MSRRRDDDDDAPVTVAVVGAGRHGAHEPHKGAVPPHGRVIPGAARFPPAIERVSVGRACACAWYCTI